MHKLTIVVHNEPETTIILISHICSPMGEKIKKEPEPR
jgi:hypothetical protein